MVDQSTIELWRRAPRLTTFAEFLMRGGSSFGPCLPFLVIGQGSEFKLGTAAVTLQKVPRKKLRQAACSRAASKAAMVASGPREVKLLAGG